MWLFLAFLRFFFNRKEKKWVGNRSNTAADCQKEKEIDEEKRDEEEEEIW